MIPTQEMRVERIDPHTLKPHPDNPRIEIDESDPVFMAFVDNIIANDIIQPIVATKIAGENFILAGHRRTKAACIAKITTVPVIFREIPSGKYPEDFFLSENGQRNDLSPLEDARAIDKLRQHILVETGKDPVKGDLSRRLNLPIAQINQAFALLELPEKIQLLYHKLELPMSSSVQLVKLKGYPEEIEAFANRLITRQITNKNLATLILRRLQDLQETGPLDTGRKSHFHNKHRYVPDGTRDVAITRTAAAANLQANTRNHISLFDINVILDNVCCHCGMMNNETVCSTCPLPKFVNGIVGRSTSK